MEDQERVKINLQMYLQRNDSKAVNKQKLFISTRVNGMRKSAAKI